MIQNFFILAFIAQICFTASTSEPIALDVYYETLCPDTIRFYKEQLYPAWEKLKDSGRYITAKIIQVPWFIYITF